MAYRFDGLGRGTLFGEGLLWQAELWQDGELFNYQPFFIYPQDYAIFKPWDLGAVKVGYDSNDTQNSQEAYTEKPVVSEGPLFAPPVAQNDTIIASSLVTTFDLFADNGFGADTDPDGDTLTITQINGVAIIQGQQAVLNNGLLVTYLGNGDVQFTTTGLGGGDVATDTFTYTVDDGNGETGSATVNVTFVVNAVTLAGIPPGVGTRFFGAPDGFESGFSVSNLRDINGDGIDDVIIGAPGQGASTGVAYIVFGNGAGLGDNFDLFTLNGTNGFRVDGLAAVDGLGSAVSDAGDLNGDGINDFLIGASNAGPQNAFGNGQGEAYVIFGTNAGFSANFDLSTLNGANGFTINGRGGDVGIGVAMSAAGDINGDGFDDILVGSNGDSELGDLAHAFVIYGTNLGFPSDFDLDTLDGTNGFVVSAGTILDGTGQAVTGLGDIDGDGIDDFAIGAPGADGAFGVGSFTGEVYVILGNAAGFGASFDLATLNGANGFVINAISVGVSLGSSISDIGDINGDGLTDILVSAPFADSSTGASAAGQAYVIYGAPSFGPSFDLSTLNGLNGFAIDGLNAFDTTGFSVSGVGDINGDDVNDFVIGAPDANPNGNSQAGQSYLIFGGTFGANAVLDLTTLNGTTGFAIFGEDVSDSSGRSVSGAGDVNNDGFDDLLIGAPGANEFGNGPQGESYILYGFDPAAAGNNPPIANDDDFTIDEDSMFSGDVFADNGMGIDSDPDGDNFVVSLINGQAFTVGDTFNINGGTVTITGNGTFDFTTDGNFEALGVGDTSVGSLTYTIDDGNGGTATATATITVTGVNDAPIASDDAFTTNEDNDVDGNVFDNNGIAFDSDVEADLFTVTEVNAAPGNVGANVMGSTGGIFIIQADGTFNFQPNGDFDNLAVGESTTSTTSYTIDDGNGGTDTATVTVTINGDNDAPVGFDPGTGLPPGDPLNYIPAQAVADGAAIADLDLSPFFVDPDATDTLSITVDIAALPPGLLYDLATNTITGTPTASASQGGPNNDGIYSVQVTASDGNGGVFMTFVTFNVSNPAPIAEDDNLSTDEATNVTGNVFSDNGVNPDSDPDGDVFIVSEVNNSALNVGLAIAGSTGGLFTINADGTFTFDPNGDFDALNAGDSNDTTIIYTIDDGEGGFSRATVTVTVNGLNAVNTPPVASDDAFTTDEDNAVGGNVFDDNGNGFDEDIDGDIFTVSAVGGAPGNIDLPVAGSNGGLFIIQANGVFSFQPNGDFDGLGVGQSDTSTMTYTIDDGRGGTSTATVTVTINGVNDAPIAQDDSLNGRPDENRFDLFADNGNGADTDPDGDALVITHIDGISVQPGSDVVLQSGLTVHYIGAGEIELRTLQPGLYNETFTYTVSDGQGGTDTATIDAQFNADFVDLADVNDFGLGINGVAAGDESGFAVSSAGDVNGDGFADFMIGAHFAGPNANGDPGATYVIFGSQGRPAPQGQDFNLSDINGTNGFVLTGIDQFDNSGWSIAAPGDVNGDGIDDMLISGHLGDPNGGQSGEVYVVFGGQNFGASFDLGSLNGTNGFVLNGIDDVDQAGYEVAGLGDLNGDGINDFIIGARGADTEGDNHTGEAYVVFGSADGFDPVFELADLDGTNGFTIAGVTAEGFLGAGIAGAPGDFDGDGISDALIGIPGIDGQPGQAMILFGDAGGFNARVDVDNLNGLGILITGIDPGGQLGFDLTGLGDVNGDGIDDFALAAPFADPGGLTDAGEVYVVFGGAGIRNGVDLGALDGTNGFTISGDQAGLDFGFSVGAAGDFDGDGIDDFIIGAPSVNGTGGALLIYGNANGFPANFDIDGINGNDGFFIGGVAAGDDAGFAVAGIGDVDGDGFDDLLIGAPGADANGNADSGQSYILPGFSRVGANPAEVVEKKVISDVFTGDGSGNAVVSELPPTDKPIVPDDDVSDDDSFVFIEKAVVSDDVMGWSTAFGDVVIDQDILAEFMAQVQILRETHFRSDTYLELSHESAENDLSYFTDFFNYL